MSKKCPYGDGGSRYSSTITVKITKNSAEIILNIILCAQGMYTKLALKLLLLLFTD